MKACPRHFLSLCVRSPASALPLYVCDRASVSIHPISLPTSLSRSAAVAQLAKQAANYEAFFFFSPFLLASICSVCLLCSRFFHNSESQHMELNKRKSHIHTHTAIYPQIRTDTQAQSIQSITSPFGLRHPHHYTLCLHRLNDL